MIEVQPDGGVKDWSVPIEVKTCLPGPHPLRIEILLEVTVIVPSEALIV
jgi:hypothetical protein